MASGFSYGGQAPPSAAPPADAALKQRIDTLSAYAAKNGPAFVQTILERQGGNPEYSFIRGGEGAAYYSWALYCKLNGLPVEQPQRSAVAAMAAPPAAAATSATQPAPTPQPHAVQQPAQQQQQQQQEPPDPILASLPVEVSSGWQQVLGLLTGSRDSIRNSQQWFFACAPYAAGMAEMMLQQVLHLADSQKQLHVVYLSNDILFKGLSDRAEGVGPDADPIALAFKPRLGRMLRHAYLTAGQAAEAQQNLLRVMNFWAERGVFDHLTVEQLTMELMGISVGAGADASGGSSEQGAAGAKADAAADQAGAAAGAAEQAQGAGTAGVSQALEQQQPPQQAQHSRWGQQPRDAGAGQQQQQPHRSRWGQQPPNAAAGQPQQAQEQWGPPSGDASAGQQQQPWGQQPTVAQQQLQQQQQYPPGAGAAGYPGPPPPESYYSQPPGGMPGAPLPQQQQQQAYGAGPAALPDYPPPPGGPAAVLGMQPGSFGSSTPFHHSQPGGMPQAAYPPPHGAPGGPPLHQQQQGFGGPPAHYPGQPPVGFFPPQRGAPPGAYPPPSGAGPGDVGYYPPPPVPEPEPEPEGFDPMSFPPGLIPKLVEDKLKTDPPYSPLSILDIERTGVPPPPKVDAYLKARVDKMYAQLADYRPGMLYSDIEVDAPRRGKHFSDRDQGPAPPPLPPTMPDLPHAGLGLGMTAGIAMGFGPNGMPIDDGSFSGPSTAPRGGGGSGLGWASARQEQRQQRERERAAVNDAAAAAEAEGGAAAAGGAANGEPGGPMDTAAAGVPDMGLGGGVPAGPGTGGPGGDEAGTSAADVFSSYRFMRSKGYHQMILENAAKKFGR